MGAAPSKPDPKRHLEVIGAGYCRTGTVSIQLALEKLLDGPVLHGATQLMTREDSFSRNWVELYKAKHGGDKELTLKLAKNVTAGFVGCTDFPYICITAELLELYPEAKVVLVTRDAKECWGSFSLILNYSDAWFVPYLSIIAPSLRWWPALVSAWKKETDILLSETGGVEGQYGPGVVEAHNKRIMELVPKERLLVMTIGEGWGPLCKFLNKPIPNEPFPRENDTEAAAKVAGAAYAKLMFIWLGLGVTVGGPLYLGYRMWYR